MIKLTEREFKVTKKGDYIYPNLAVVPGDGCIQLQSILDLKEGYYYQLAMYTGYKTISDLYDFLEEYSIEASKIMQEYALSQKHLLDEEDKNLIKVTKDE